MNSRDTILSRLDSMDNNQAFSSLPGIYEWKAKPHHTLLEPFKTTAEKNGINIIFADDNRSIPSLITSRLTRPHDPTKRWCIAPELRDLDWAERDTIHFGTNNGRFDIGISHANAGIAQTGALLLVNDAKNPSTIGFLSETHFFILNESDILASMTSYWNCGDTATNAVHFIAGPSSTADIGGKHLVGVHGPKLIICIIVSNSSAAKK